MKKKYTYETYNKKFDLGGVSGLAWVFVSGFPIIMLNTIFDTIPRIKKYGHDMNWVWFNVFWACVCLAFGIAMIIGQSRGYAKARKEALKRQQEYEEQVEAEEQERAKNPYLSFELGHTVENAVQFLNMNPNQDYEHWNQSVLEQAVENNWLDSRND